MESKMIKKPFDGFILKMIAIVTMVIDHTAVAFIDAIPYDIYIIMRIIGRIAMPIFCYLIVEGVLHTGHFPKYALRMLAFAILSEVPFDYIITRSFVSFDYQNVMWTLLFGMLTIYICDKARQKDKLLFVCVCIIVPLFFGLLCHFCNTDYGLLGLYLIFLLWLFHEKPVLLIIALVALLIPFQMIYTGQTAFTIFKVTVPLPLEAFGIISAIPICLYNGRRGLNNKLIKYIFYAFYPVHLAVLCLLRIIISR